MSRLIELHLEWLISIKLGLAKSNQPKLFRSYSGINNRTTEIYLHSIDEQAREAMRLVAGEFSVRTMTRSHYHNEDEKIRNSVTY